MVDEPGLTVEEINAVTADLRSLVAIGRAADTAQKMIHVLAVAVGNKDAAERRLATLQVDIDAATANLADVQAREHTARAVYEQAVAEITAQFDEVKRGATEQSEALGQGLKFAQEALAGAKQDVETETRRLMAVRKEVDDLTAAVARLRPERDALETKIADLGLQLEVMQGQARALAESAAKVAGA
jgi:chromosome segregation ATPase